MNRPAARTANATALAISNGTTSYKRILGILDHAADRRALLTKDHALFACSALLAASLCSIQLTANARTESPSKRSEFKSMAASQFAWPKEDITGTGYIVMNGTQLTLENWQQEAFLDFDQWFEKAVVTVGVNKPSSILIEDDRRVIARAKNKSGVLAMDIIGKFEFSPHGPDIGMLGPDSQLVIRQLKNDVLYDYRVSNLASGKSEKSFLVNGHKQADNQIAEWLRAARTDLINMTGYQSEQALMALNKVASSKVIVQKIHAFDSSSARTNALATMTARPGLDKATFHAILAEVERLPFSAQREYVLHAARGNGMRFADPESRQRVGKTINTIESQRVRLELREQFNNP